MKSQQEPWVAAFASQLLANWPRLDAGDAEHLGEALWCEAPWRELDPAAAAERWISRSASAKKGEVIMCPRTPRTDAQ